MVWYALGEAFANAAKSSVKKCSFFGVDFEAKGGCTNKAVLCCFNVTRSGVIGVMLLLVSCWCWCHVGFCVLLPVNGKRNSTSTVLPASRKRKKSTKRDVGIFY